MPSLSSRGICVCSRALCAHIKANGSTLGSASPDSISTNILVARVRAYEKERGGRGKEREREREYIRPRSERGRRGRRRVHEEDKNGRVKWEIFAYHSAAN